MKVIKRDCSEVDFDISKIQNAIIKAMKNGSGIVNEKIAEDIASEIYEENINKDEVSIFDIESAVFNKLIRKKQSLTARSYEGYRSIREYQRDITNSTDKTIHELIGGTSEYWNTENSNKNPVIVSTQRDYLAGITSEDITKRFLLTPEIVQAHNEGILHFHDVDYFVQQMHNCDLVNLKDMLQNGTVISKTLIEKPNSFSTACNIATQIIAQVASSQHGGQSISLSHLAPFVQISRDKIYTEVLEEISVLECNATKEQISKIVEKRLRKEIVKGVQTIQYQIVTLMTTNGQAPFLTVFMYLNEAESEQEKKDLAIIIEEALKQRYQGVKNEDGIWITPAFPKLIYVLQEDNVYKDSEYYYLTEIAAKCTAKRLVPDYISEKKMKELKEGNCFPVMGCRSALSPWKDDNGDYKFYGRFNQGVVTLNLVDVALSSEGEYKKFWELLDERSELCHRALKTRHNRLKGTVSDVAPILWQHGALARLKSGETIDKLLYDGYSTISLGYAGLYECVKYMTGLSHTQDKGKEFGLNIMKYLNDKCDTWKALEKIGYSIYGSPIESTTYKFSKCLKKRFGKIEGITDKNYITNSYHVPVFEEIDAFTKLKLESEFQSLSVGGAISYVEIPNMNHNIEAVLQLIKYIYDNIMYAELNTKSDYCQECGYDGELLIDDEMKWYCPKCGNRNQAKMNVARRTCGYIGSNYWNLGRTQEIKERVLHL